MTRVAPEPSPTSTAAKLITSMAGLCTGADKDMADSASAVTIETPAASVAVRCSSLADRTWLHQRRQLPHTRLASLETLGHQRRHMTSTCRASVAAPCLADSPTLAHQRRQLTGTAFRLSRRVGSRQLNMRDDESGSHSIARSPLVSGLRLGGSAAGAP